MSLGEVSQPIAVYVDLYTVIYTLGYILKLSEALGPDSSSQPLSPLLNVRHCAWFPFSFLIVQDGSGFSYVLPAPALKPNHLFKEPISSAW